MLHPRRVGDPRAPQDAAPHVGATRSRASPEGRGEGGRRALSESSVGAVTFKGFFADRHVGSRQHYLNIAKVRAGRLGKRERAEMKAGRGDPSSSMVLG